MLPGADVFVGVSGPGLITAADLRTMADDPIVFAMANPDPEITPEDADGIARVIATGRSDYPNQINNVLAFPGIFRGALDVAATTITEGMKLAAAKAIAACVSDDQLAADHIIPSVFDPAVAPAVAEAVARPPPSTRASSGSTGCPSPERGPRPGSPALARLSSSRRGCRAGGSGRATGWRGRPRSGAGASRRPCRRAPWSSTPSSSTSSLHGWPVARLSPSVATWSSAAGAGLGVVGRAVRLDHEDHRATVVRDAGRRGLRGHLR